MTGKHSHHTSLLAVARGERAKACFASIRPQRVRSAAARARASPIPTCCSVRWPSLWPVRRDERGVAAVKYANAARSFLDLPWPPIAGLWRLSWQTCERLSLAQLVSPTRRTALAGRGRAGSRLADLEGGVGTLSNLGMYRVDRFEGIISPGTELHPGCWKVARPAVGGRQVAGSPRQPSFSTYRWITGWPTAPQRRPSSNGLPKSSKTLTAFSGVNSGRGGKRACEDASQVRAFRGRKEDVLQAARMLVSPQV